jgi:hypothetical protein
MRPRALRSIWVFRAAWRTMPAAQVHAAFVAALAGLYAKVQSAAAVAAEIAS